MSDSGNGFSGCNSEALSSWYEVGKEFVRRLMPNLMYYLGWLHITHSPGVSFFLISTVFHSSYQNVQYSSLSVVSEPFLSVSLCLSICMSLSLCLSLSSLSFRIYFSRSTSMYVSVSSSLCLNLSLSLCSSIFVRLYSVWLSQCPSLYLFVPLSLSLHLSLPPSRLLILLVIYALSINHCKYSCVFSFPYHIACPKIMDFCPHNERYQLSVCSGASRAHVFYIRNVCGPWTLRPKSIIAVCTVELCLS